jgi:polyisoprenoid-binding protein YceI
VDVPDARPRQSRDISVNPRAWSETAVQVQPYLDKTSAGASNVNHRKQEITTLKRYIRVAVMLAGLALVFGLYDSRTQAQGQAPAGQPPPGARAGGGRSNVPPPDPTKPAKLEITEGTKARYKVREQLAGINFPSDAVGTTESVTGTLVLNPDGSFDAAQSKLTVDLRTLKSDQQMRDGYIQKNTLESEKFPMIEFVPRRAVGLPVPLPAGMQAQGGFQLVGDMTLHGVTREVTWNVVATFGNDLVAGRATTTLLFPTFNLAKPSLARIMSVDDKIELEIEFKCKRSVL